MVEAIFLEKKKPHNARVKRNTFERTDVPLVCNYLSLFFFLLVTILGQVTFRALFLLLVRVPANTTNLATNPGQWLGHKPHREQEEMIFEMLYFLIYKAISCDVYSRLLLTPK